MLRQRWGRQKPAIARTCVERGMGRQRGRISLVERDIDVAKAAKVGMDLRAGWAFNGADEAA